MLNCGFGINRWQYAVELRNISLMIIEYNKDVISYIITFYIKIPTNIDYFLLFFIYTRR